MMKRKDLIEELTLEFSVPRKKVVKMVDAALDFLLDAVKNNEGFHSPQFVLRRKQVKPDVDQVSKAKSAGDVKQKWICVMRVPDKKPATKTQGR